ncbi:MAG: TetR/AcrR family transcriptional regulator [Flaviramulus sp.]|nr:TetR/AcrR family transcriptional regulator [Flaviramulus sp.]NNC49910.1 TetR/AcrR family transcriptional regulator [Flaviramulus sp.]
MNKNYIDSGRKNQKHKTRSKILLVAQRLLAKGIGLTLEDIAKEADLSRATIYRYYSNVDVLAAEAVIDIHTKSPEDVFNEVKDLNLKEVLMAIQAYFNDLAFTNEAAFRKYLSIAIVSDQATNKRGARRIKTMELALANKKTPIDNSEIEKLKNIATVLMGIEALIVSKDVCGLNEQQSKETLKWGLEMLLKGVLNNQN